MSQPLRTRVPEPELMDAEDQVQAYANADFSSSDQALVEWWSQNVPEGLGDRVLDLGCGPGNISLLLVQRWLDLVVTGLDGAPRMLAVARQRQGLLPSAQAIRLNWHCGTLPTHGLRNTFTALVSNSLLHHLHDPQTLWTCLPLLGSPGAKVMIHDLRRPTDEANLQALIERYASDAPPVLKRDYEASLRAAFTAEEVEEQLAEAGLSELKVSERDDRYLAVVGQLPT